jgi:hypothetical protein
MNRSSKRSVVIRRMRRRSCGNIYETVRSREQSFAANSRLGHTFWIFIAPNQGWPLSWMADSMARRAELRETSSGTSISGMKV